MGGVGGNTVSEGDGNGGWLRVVRRGYTAAAPKGVFTTVLKVQGLLLTAKERPWRVGPGRACIKNAGRRGRYGACERGAGRRVPGVPRSEVALRDEAQAQDYRKNTHEVRLIRTLGEVEVVVGLGVLLDRRERRAAPGLERADGLLDLVDVSRHDECVWGGEKNWDPRR